MKIASQLASQLESMTLSITSSITKISRDIDVMTDENEGIARINSFKSDLHAIDNKIDKSLHEIYSQYVIVHDSEDKEQELKIKEFTSKHKGRIADLLIQLSSKIKDVTSHTHSTYERKSQTNLKKIDPPTFKGDIIEYADFKRKWKAQVSTDKLCTESELDRLGDNVPGQAGRALYGETTLSGAWKILDQLYGDKGLLANKLKNQLKSIKPKGKTDEDIVIDLVTDVKNIVLRLETLEMDKMLHYDNEFLSAVYRSLPAAVKSKWLEFDKKEKSSQWDAFMIFLEKSRSQALESKVLLSSYSPSNQRDGVERSYTDNKVKSNAATIQADKVEKLERDR